MSNTNKAGFLQITQPKKNTSSPLEFYETRWQWFTEEFVSLSLEIPEDLLQEFNALSLIFGKKDETIEQRISSLKVNVSDEIPMPEVVLSICDHTGNNKRMVMTKQNISCITAQAKVGKTYLLKLIVSSLLNKSLFQNRLFGELEPKSKILYIDTEQSKFHVRLGLSQIQQLLNVNAKEMERLDVYQFDAISTLERKEFTKWLIYNNNYDVVILDGISDLALDSNNLQESDELVRDLRVWATDKNCHIVNIIHLNPSDQSTKMKGHLGTKLMDKSEIVIGVSIDKENDSNRIVQSLASRNRKPDPFEFTITESGLPEIVNEFVPEYKVQGKKPTKAEKPDMDIYRMLCNIYASSKDNWFMYGKLKTAITLQYEVDFKETIGETLARKILEKSLLKGWIMKDGEPKSSRYYLGEFTSKNGYNYEPNNLDF